MSARRHVADGQRFVLLHDRTTGQTHRVTERAWAILGAMDGTRDAEGLAARARAGRFTVDATEAQAFVDDVFAAGLLAPEGGAAPLRSSGPFVPPDRPLEPLPGYRLACDGAGSCCRLFPTITFTPRDVARARAAQPDVLDGGDDETRAFMPAHGHRHPLSVVTLVDGRCGYLERDGRCGIHAAHDASWKPFGCRTFPLSFVDDGTSVRVAPRPECACVPRSASGEGGDALLPDSVLARGDLQLETYVHAVPDPVPIGRDGRDAPRDLYAAWSRALADGPTTDVAAAFAALADALDERGLDAARDAALVAAPPPIPWDCMRERLERLREGAGRRGDEGFRSSRDLAQQAFVALETACELALAAPEPFTAGPRSAEEAAAERFHFRAVIFGHLAWHLASTTDLAEGFRGFAARVIAGRALGAVAELSGLRDPAFSWPLSLVEALCRAYDLTAEAPAPAAATGVPTAPPSAPADAPPT